MDLSIHFNFQSIQLHSLATIYTQIKRQNNKNIQKKSLRIEGK